VFTVQAVHMATQCAPPLLPVARRSADAT